jgi:CrcB protein
VTAARRATLVATGAAFGGIFRMVLAVLLPVAASDPALAAPALLVVNVSGSLLAGFLRGLATDEERAGRSAEGMEALMVVGFCGGYTSYSAFVASLHEGVAGGLPWTVALVAATLVLCPLAAALGMRASGGPRGGYPAKPIGRAEKEPA